MFTSFRHPMSLAVIGIVRRVFPLTGNISWKDSVLPSEFPAPYSSGNGHVVGGKQIKYLSTDILEQHYPTFFPANYCSEFSDSAETSHFQSEEKNISPPQSFLHFLTKTAPRPRSSKWQRERVSLSGRGRLLAVMLRQRICQRRPWRRGKDIILV